MNFSALQAYNILAMPVLRDHSIPVKIKRYYTDVDGIIFDKALAPAALQVRFPFFLFGKWDKDGGYRIGLNINPPDPGTFYVMTYTEGIGIPFLQSNAFNTVHGQINTGDLVHVYTNDLVNPTYFIWIILQNPAASFASIVDNSMSAERDGHLGRLFCSDYMYRENSANQVQLNEAIHYTRFDNIGNIVDQSIQPLLFKTPDTEQTGFLRIETNFRIDQYLGIYSYMRFETDQISLTFNIKKIAPNQPVTNGKKI